ncbi:transporter substrate-binding domain-containing protein [Enterococcus dongliensis]|uniref:transporter substrate-binding domain-containing protein n=1 Tax=Enterococcus dongliensis TaxID=2559925 RepID=UPI0028924E10|nr:transporter substrate-binding domain-containing protein [Enterococcus dongliensis]MDT2612472.1 transporter substrate-binding domain-containing protein [Enterococcus dongliensis]
MKKRALFLLLTSVITILVLAGCGSNKNDTKNADESNKKQITIATSSAPKPFTYVNDQNELEGYDIDVVKAIFKKIGKYDVDFEKTEFTSVLSGLDTDRYQVGANNFAMNEERKEKYIYSNPIFKNQYVIAVAENTNSIKSFEDLQGKSTEVSPGLNYATALENYNKENPDNKVAINYSEAELLNVLQNVETGKYDFQLIDKAMAQQFIKEHDLKLKLIDLSETDVKRIGSPYSYLLISKTDDGEKLTKEINEALKEATDDGTLTEISEKYFNEDFAPKD